MTGAQTIAAGGNGARKRVKIFTVHGTFANEAEWDNWDQDDAQKVGSAGRHFINLLSDYLRAKGVDFDEADHTEFNWSGINSHEDRRTAAFDLKTRIQKELRDIEIRTGQDYRSYYDGGIYIVAHSHGGTLTRLALNVWDDPDSPPQTDRPDGVVTFGSPFIHFKPRALGLLGLRLAAWSTIVIGLVVLLIYYLSLFADKEKAANAPSPQPDATDKGVGALGELFEFFKPAMVHFWSFLGEVWPFVWPIVCFWIFVTATRLDFFLGDEKLYPSKGEKWKPKQVGAWLIGALGAGACIAYYGVAAYNQSWVVANNWFNNITGGRLWDPFLTPLILYYLFAIRLPSRLLGFLRRHVAELREELPRKYDPPENAEMKTRYLSYYTPGDEAGLHLRVFGVLTWIVQTLWLTAGVVIATGILAPIIMLLLSGLFGSNTLVPLWNAVMALPVLLQNTLFAPLGGSELSFLDPATDPKEVAEYPYRLFAAGILIVILLMPIFLVVILIGYLIAIWLRGSGMVFGSEKFAWVMAADIGAGIRPSRFAKMRRVLIAPEAWSKGELVHCYFYRSDKVIKDVADHIADWKNMVVPTSTWTIGRLSAKALQWLIVLFYGLSIFAIAANMQSSPTAQPTPEKSPPAQEQKAE